MRKLSIIFLMPLIALLSSCEKKEIRVMNKTVQEIAGGWVITDFFINDAQAPQNLVQMFVLPQKGDRLTFASCSVGESGTLEGCNAAHTAADGTVLNFQFGTEPEQRYISFRMSGPGNEKLKRAFEGDWKITVTNNKMLAEKVRSYDTVSGGVRLTFTADRK